MMRAEGGDHPPRTPRKKGCGSLPLSFIVFSPVITFYCIWVLRISALSRTKKSTRLESPITYVTVFKPSYSPEPKKEQSPTVESTRKEEIKAAQQRWEERRQEKLAEPVAEKKPIEADVRRNIATEESNERKPWKELGQPKQADTVTEKKSIEVEDGRAVGREGSPEWMEGFRSESGGVPADAPPPEWCENLKQNPRERPRTGPLYGECGRPHNHVLCGDGKPMFFASHNQDMYTWQTHFRHLEGKRKGVFLDIAANDPVSRSNTFFYERCLGWKGICVEANPKYYPRLRNNRTCSLVKRCVSNQEETVEFIDDDGTGGISTTNKNPWSQKKGKGSRRTITCLETKTALKHAAPQKEEENLNIDFFSLDVEGHELQVLQGINWNTTKISVITVENARREIREFLQERGFHIKSMDRDPKGKVLYGQMWNDVLYVHNSVVWGAPI